MAGLASKYNIDIRKPITQGVNNGKSIQVVNDENVIVRGIVNQSDDYPCFPSHILLSSDVSYGVYVERSCHTCLGRVLLVKSTDAGRTYGSPLLIRNE